MSTTCIIACEARRGDCAQSSAKSNESRLVTVASIIHHSRARAHSLTLSLSLSLSLALLFVLIDTMMFRALWCSVLVLLHVTPHMSSIALYVNLIPDYMLNFTTSKSEQAHKHTDAKQAQDMAHRRLPVC